MQGIDSNILVYAYDSNAGDKHKKAFEFLKKYYLGEEKGMISSQTLGEFFTTVTRKRCPPMPKLMAQDIIQSLIDLPHIWIVDYDSGLIIEAIKQTSSIKRFWATLIATTLLQNGITTIYTENTKDFEHTGIKAVNPL